MALSFLHWKRDVDKEAMIHWILAAPRCTEITLVLWGFRREEMYNSRAGEYAFVPHFRLCEQSMVVV